MRIGIINGPNLNLLGTREPAVYGRVSLAEIEEHLAELAVSLGVEVSFHHSNHEGELIDFLHGLRGTHDAAILNPGGLAHTSVVLRDAVASIDIPVVEVHLSNTFAREEFRHRSYTASVCRGVIIGLGPFGYDLALHAAIRLARRGDA